jgi:hypothetical protein
VADPKPFVDYYCMLFDWTTAANIGARDGTEKAKLASGCVRTKGQTDWGRI